MKNIDWYYEDSTGSTWLIYILTLYYRINIGSEKMNIQEQLMIESSLFKLTKKCFKICLNLDRSSK